MIFQQFGKLYGILAKMSKINKYRILDFCLVFLALAFILLVFSVYLMHIAKVEMKLPESATVFRILRGLSKLSVGVFFASFLPLWVFSWVDYFERISTRGWVKNIFWVSVIIGFSWISAVYIYWVSRKAFKRSEG